MQWGLPVREPEVTGDRSSKLLVWKWYLPAFTALATAGVLVGGGEFVSQRAYHSTKTQESDCLVFGDTRTGVRARPGSICWQKTFEEPRAVEYNFNACGYRSAVSGPKPSGTYRIVLEGTSMAEGLRVPQERTFGFLLPLELSRRTGRRVELYNESLTWHTPRDVALRFGEVLAAQPDMVLWVVNYWDLEHASALLPSEPKGLLRNLLLSSESLSWRWTALVQYIQGHSKLLIWAEHVLYQDRALYVKQYLANTQDSMFLKAPPDAAWRQNLKAFATYFATVAARAKAAGVPLVVTVIPQRAQAAMISSGAWPPGFNPYQVGEDVRSIVEREGGTYIDVLRGFKTIPHAMENYYPVDGHPDTDGHAILARLLADALLSDRVWKK